MSNIELSIVVPVHEQADNVEPLVEEIAAALRGVTRFEVVYVDDASGDGTDAALHRARGFYPELRALRHRQHAGRSTAVRTGVHHARGRWIATLDGDGRNDPADIPHLLAAREAGDASVKLVAGWRMPRRAGFVHRASSRIASGVHRRVLGAPDTGCGLKLFERRAFLDLPRWDPMHRFLPALFRRAGHGVVSVPVRQRPRANGEPGYGIGKRLWTRLAGLRGVGWLMRRAPGVDATEIERP